MELEFLGGASEVGRLGMVMRHQGATLLFDYGMLPEDPPKYPLQAPPVDMLLLSHAHLDHCGMVPWVVARHDVEVVATETTMATSEVLLYDSIKVARIEGHPEPFGEEDVKATLRNLHQAEIGDIVEAASIEVTLHAAGHIPGSTMFEANAGQVMLFTGDLQTINTELMWGARPDKCDVLIMESTYAGRSHPPREQTQREFLARVKDVVERGGTVLCPTFAVARTQEVLLTLARAGFEVWLDGMGKEINRVYLSHPDSVRSHRKLREAIGKAKVIHSPRGRETAVQGDVIVTTSGMLDGGPALYYLQRMGDEPRNAVFMTGYQVDGTNGRLLQDEGVVEVQGARLPIRCEVERFDFSAHAGHDELVKFVDRCDPRVVVLMHGENREAIARELGGRETILPMEGKPFALP